MRLANSGLRSIFPPRGFIIGAPKCGTTALAQYLSEHPQVAFSKPKEPHYFSNDLPGLQRTQDLKLYRSFFAPTDQTRLLMEASVWYLYSQTAIRAILQARPDARFIVMLRNPVRMLPSLHRQLVNAFDEDEEDFETAWRLSDLRARGQQIPNRCRAPATLIYKSTAAFGEMLDRLWSEVPRDRTLVLFQEEMQADTAAVYRRALAFLGLDDDARQVFPRVNAAKRPRSRLLSYTIARGGALRQLISRPIKTAYGIKSLGVTKRLKQANSVPLSKISVRPEMEQEISQHYADELRQLAALFKGQIPRQFGWPPQDKPAAPTKPTQISTQDED